MALWLLIDVSYICHRAFHAMGELSHEGVKTGVLYGFFREVADTADLVGADHLAFCCDVGHVYRSGIYPAYKEARRTKVLTDEEKEARNERNRQITLLRLKYLPQCGYRNIFAQDGYEADDMIAAACAALPEGDEACIVSADQDLWQLLSARVWVWNPASKTALTYEGFKRAWGIDPALWPHVKAWAGCTSDGIEGLPGIGDKTAALYLAGKLRCRKGGGIYKRGVRVADCTCRACAIAGGLAIHNRNIMLTRLPAPGTERPVWREDEVTPARRDAVFEKLGFKSLLSPRAAGVRPEPRGFV